jgi:hypothetical protein
MFAVLIFVAWRILLNKLRKLMAAKDETILALKGNDIKLYVYG